MVTAVEWFVKNIDWQLLKNTTTHYNMIVEKAKEMEKQQIEDAFIDGCLINGYSINIEKGEQYYNETFKTK